MGNHLLACEVAYCSGGMVAPWAILPVVAVVFVMAGIGLWIRAGRR